MLPLLAIAALVLGTWTSWLVRTARRSRWLYVPTALAAIGIPALAWLTVARLSRTFDDVAGVAAASDRQVILSHGISDAMLPTAVALGAVGVWLVALTIATLRLRRRGRPR